MADTMPRTDARLAACAKLARQSPFWTYEEDAELLLLEGVRSKGSGESLRRAARSSSGWGLLVGLGGGVCLFLELLLMEASAPAAAPVPGEPSLSGDTGELGLWLPADGRAAFVGDAYGSAAVVVLV
jgi:hypothetical protein